MKRSQLNAISRSYTKKAQSTAICKLLKQGIVFKDYCKFANYKGTPVKLCTLIESGAKRTLLNVNNYLTRQ